MWSLTLRKHKSIPNGSLLMTEEAEHSGTRKMYDPRTRLDFNKWMKGTFSQGEVPWNLNDASPPQSTQIFIK